MDIKGRKIEKIIELLPSEWESKAKETGALSRSRKIKNAGVIKAKSLVSNERRVVWKNKCDVKINRRNKPK